MLWVALIYDKYERNIGLNKIMQIAAFLKNNVDIDLPYFSFILDLPKEEQLKNYNYIKSETKSDILSLLTLIFLYSNKYFINLLKKFSFHKDNHTTDIRFIDIYYELITDKLRLPKESIHELYLFC